jgi:hypothetical protein
MSFPSCQEKNKKIIDPNMRKAQKKRKNSVSTRLEKSLKARFRRGFKRKVRYLLQAYEKEK